MSARLRCRGSIILAFAFALTAFLSSDSGAIQLRWKSGAFDLSFIQARSCTLLVQADSGCALPLDWRLLWIAGNSSGPPPVLNFESEPEAVDDPAAAYELLAPTDPSEVASGVVGRAIGSRRRRPRWHLLRSRDHHLRARCGTPAADSLRLAGHRGCA